MSKSWSEVIENIDLSTKPLREPRKLSCDEITDLKEKCNPKYDLTILDLICTIEALQQENEQLRAQVAKLQEVLRGIEKEYVNDFTDEELDEGLCSRDNAILNYWVRPVLNYGTVDYHNPADVEALRKAIVFTIVQEHMKLSLK